MSRLKYTREIQPENYPNFDGERMRLGMEFHDCVCGGKPVAFRTTDGLWRAMCNKCELRTADHAILEDARRAWNKSFEKELPVEYITVRDENYKRLKNDYQEMLHVGDRFANYTSLANSLGEKWPPKSSQARAKKRKQWSQFFAWEWVDHHIVITEIYENPELMARVIAPRRSKFLMGLEKARREGRVKEYRKEYFSSPGVRRSMGRPKKKKALDNKKLF